MKAIMEKITSLDEGINHLLKHDDSVEMRIAIEKMIMLPLINGKSKEESYYIQLKDKPPMTIQEEHVVIMLEWVVKRRWENVKLMS